MNKSQERRKRSVFSNYRFAHGIMHSEKKWKTHVEDVLYVISGVASPFVGIAFPSFALIMLQGTRPISETLGLILLYVLGMKALGMMMAYYNNRQQMNYFLGRIHSMGPLREHILYMDYESLESKEGQSKLRGANECVYTGNDRGIEAFLLQFPKLLMNLIGFALYSVLVIHISFGVFVFMVFTALGMSFLNLRVGKFSSENQKNFKSIFIKRKRAFEETMDDRSRGDAILYQMKTWICNRLYAIRDELGGYYKKICRIESSTAGWLTVLNFLRDALVYFILIGQIKKGTMDVSTLILMVGVIAGYSQWMQEVLVAIQQITVNSDTVDLLRDFLEFGNEGTQDSQTQDTAFKEVCASYDIRLENVSFRYEGAEEDVLSGVNLSIRKGEKIALVGSNGAGKTTLVKLITGLYTPTQGKIYIGGVDTQTLAKKQIFSLFSVVFQEMKVYACSIAENVACALSPDREKVMSCLMKSGLWEKVSTFEKGMDMPMTQKLEQDGVQLSGGQNQKLMLARALYQGAPILILDEPTAALDPIAENEMYQTYHDFSGDKTSLFISHRLSSTRFCDRVCFLKGGMITEMGTHESLMANQGDYAKMFQIQSRYYQEENPMTFLEEAI